MNKKIDSSPLKRAGPSKGISDYFNLNSAANQQHTGELNYKKFSGEVYNYKNLLANYLEKTQAN